MDGRRRRSRKVTAPDLVGQRLGEFEIVDVVGAGGMGAVYKAYQPSLDRTVALKILPQSISASPNSLERFTREARADILAQAETAWHRARDDAKALLDKGKHPDARTVLRPVIEQYGMPEYADEARRMLAEIAAPPVRDQQNREAHWRQTKAKADGLVKQHRFGEAIKAYEQLDKQHRDRELRDRVGKAVAAVRKSAEAAWLAVEKEARKQLGQSKHDQAVAALKPALEAYAIDPLKKKAETLRDQILAAKAKAATDAATAKASQAEQRVTAAMKTVDARLAALDVQGAAAALNKVPSAGLSKHHSARLATRRDEIERVAKLKAGIIEKVKKLQPWLRRGTVPVPGSGGKTCRDTGLQVASANDEAVTLRDVRAVGEKTRRVTWADLDDAVLAKLLALTVSTKSGDDQLAAALLALSRKDTAAAEKHFEKAATLGVKIDRYLDPLAAAAFTKAEALLDKGKFTEAADALTGLEKKYAQTTWLASHRRELTAAKGRIADGQAEKLYAPRPSSCSGRRRWGISRASSRSSRASTPRPHPSPMPSASRPSPSWPRPWLTSSSSSSARTAKATSRRFRLLLTPPPPEASSRSRTTDPITRRSSSPRRSPA